MTEGANSEHGSSSRSGQLDRNQGGKGSHKRKTSTQERLDGILETARGRAESLGATSRSSAPDSPRLQPLLGAALPAVHSDDGLFMRARGPSQPPNYKTLTQTRPREMGAMETTPSNGDSRRRHGGEKDRWWKVTWKSLRSIELENKGSVARDHLALERTFLAWLRTSLSFASIGVAVTQLFRLNTTLSDPSRSDMLRSLGKPLGTTFLVISIVMLFLGYRRYFVGQHYVIRGKFPASRGTIVFVSLVAFAVTVASLVVVILVQTR